jgi:hypothetical protein
VDALGIEWTLLMAQLVNFLILIVLLRMFLYQPVLNMLNARKERIAQSMKDAERVSAAAREAEAGKGQGAGAGAPRGAGNPRPGHPRRRKDRTGCARARRTGSDRDSHEGAGRRRRSRWNWRWPTPTSRLPTWRSWRPRNCWAASWPTRPSSSASWQSSWRMPGARANEQQTGAGKPLRTGALAGTTRDAGSRRSVRHPSRWARRSWPRCWPTANRQRADKAPLSKRRCPRTSRRILNLLKVMVDAGDLT